jgi:hypothetical protein
VFIGGRDVVGSMSMGGKSDMVDQGWVGVVMMGLPGDVHSENDPDRPEVGGIGNGSRRLLRSLRDGLSNETKGDGGMVVVAKRE